MIKKLSLVVAALVLGILVVAALKPDAFHIERSLDIRATPDKIFPLIDDFHRWSAWSPWEKIDPLMNRTFSGAASGPGAAYEWSGNRDIGQGRMQIIESSPQRIVIDLHFLAPFEAHNTAIFSLQPHGDTTKVIWAMDGTNAFFAKLIGIFINMDKMIGDNFETGLANLKTIAEG